MKGGKPKGAKGIGKRGRPSKTTKKKKHLGGRKDVEKPYVTSKDADDVVSAGEGSSSQHGPTRKRGRPPKGKLSLDGKGQSGPALSNSSSSSEGTSAKPVVEATPSSRGERTSAEQFKRVRPPTRKSSGQEKAKEARSSENVEVMVREEGSSSCSGPVKETSTSVGQESMLEEGDAASPGGGGGGQVAGRKRGRPPKRRISRDDKKAEDDDVTEKGSSSTEERTAAEELAATEPENQELAAGESSSSLAKRKRGRPPKRNSISGDASAEEEAGNDVDLASAVVGEESASKVAGKKRGRPPKRNSIEGSDAKVAKTDTAESERSTLAMAEEASSAALEETVAEESILAEGGSMLKGEESTLEGKEATLTYVAAGESTKSPTKTLTPVQETVLPLEKTTLSLEETHKPVVEKPTTMEEIPMLVVETSMPEEEKSKSEEEKLVPVKETPTSVLEPFLSLEETPIPAVPGCMDSAATSILEAPTSVVEGGSSSAGEASIAAVSTSVSELPIPEGKVAPSTVVEESLPMEVEEEEANSTNDPSTEDTKEPSSESESKEKDSQDDSHGDPGSLLRSILLQFGLRPRPRDDSPLRPRLRPSQKERQKQPVVIRTVLSNPQQERAAGSVDNRSTPVSTASLAGDVAALFPCPDRHCKRRNLAFRKRSALDRHTSLVHLKTKAFQCQFCEYNSAHKSNLFRHCKLKHLSRLSSDGGADISPSEFNIVLEMDPMNFSHDDVVEGGDD